MPEAAVVKAIFRSIAHFHGAWTKVFSSKDGFEAMSFTKKDVERNFGMASNQLMLKVVSGTVPP